MKTNLTRVLPAVMLAAAGTTAAQADPEKKPSYLDRIAAESERKAQEHDRRAAKAKREAEQAGREADLHQAGANNAGLVATELEVEIGERTLESARPLFAQAWLASRKTKSDLDDKGIASTLDTYKLRAIPQPDGGVKIVDLASPEAQEAPGATTSNVNSSTGAHKRPAKPAETTAASGEGSKAKEGTETVSEAPKAPVSTDPKKQPATPPVIVMKNEASDLKGVGTRRSGESDSAARARVQRNLRDLSKAHTAKP